MHHIYRWIEEVTGLTVIFQEHVLLTVIVLLTLLLFNRFLLRLVVKRQPDIRKQYQWRKTTNYFTTGLGLLLLVNIWFEGLQSIATFLGLLSAGLVVALREPLLNMAGWLFIVWKRPFRIGDRIQFGDHVGDVIDIRLFQFTLNEVREWVQGDQPTGRVVHIPNGRLFTTPQANYNYGFPFIWHEVPVHITFESNWQKARVILLEVTGRHCEKLSEATLQQVKKRSQRHLIFFDNLEPKLYVKVVDNGIQLTVRYLSKIAGRRNSENLIWVEVLTQFLAAPDIQFAYPTTRFYQTPPGTQSPLPPDGLL
ncbi:mechanosensitive ion channel [Pontibacter sp. 172403-2]|uniref:mechanosensitive ion channel family protein n=1 Tax=Pontibacter rufus TaxID=2791028 RepID=UPI0018AFABA4|nr:mechanosensitive ion channel domain-containing protein [Pontibacter sp. 172403-2]MBF9253694.1 mechanosensitive ion channel [Pontibacter sp. 172403-2]